MARITSNELETTPIIMENIFLIVTWLPLHIIVKETDSGEKGIEFHMLLFAFLPKILLHIQDFAFYTLSRQETYFQTLSKFLFWLLFFLYL